MERRARGGVPVNAEMIVGVTPPAGLFALVRGQHVPAVAFATVRISDPDRDGETFDVIKAVVAGDASEDGLVDLADCHHASECPAHEATVPTPIRRRATA
jgi:hypothetical protein